MARRIIDPMSVEETCYRCGGLVFEIERLQALSALSTNHKKKLAALQDELERRKANMMGAGFSPEPLIKIAVVERRARNKDYAETGIKQPRRFTVLKSFTEGK